MNTEEMKPCPFCGGRAAVRIRTFDIFNNEAYVECTKCKARTNAVPAGVKYTAVDRAKQLWNERTD